MQTGFEPLADDWWDETGPMAPLHRMNPTRMAYIRQMIAAHALNTKPAKTSVLDVGCGAGIACEPLARLGFNVTGIDMADTLITEAKRHAKQSELKITYQQQDIAKVKKTYDIVLVLEVLEHVDNPSTFINDCAKALKPGGLLIASTLNRTAKSFALGIFAAEYLLKWIPKGTHQWRAFIKPSEMATAMRMAGLQVQTSQGLVYNPINREFSMHPHDLDVNYFMSATKPT